MIWSAARPARTPVRRHQDRSDLEVTYPDDWLRYCPRERSSSRLSDGAYIPVQAKGRSSLRKGQVQLLVDADSVADDLVVIVEALHDMSQPIEALRGARKLLTDRGSVIVIDERTAEKFAAPGDDLDRFFYGFSLLCCLPDGMSRRPSAATGTVMRPETLRGYAAAAGFRDLVVLPMEPSFFRVYRLLP